MKRHPLDILSLLLGLVFAAVALAYLVGDLTGSVPRLQVAMPLMLAGLGGAGVVGAIAAQRRSDARQSQDEPVGYSQPAPEEAGPTTEATIVFPESNADEDHRGPH